MFVSSLRSVLFADLREQQILLILFLRKHLNFDIVNVADIYKGHKKKTISDKIKPNYCIIKYANKM
jgi:hypothetical protein